jgi:hypothetical protein
VIDFSEFKIFEFIFCTAHSFEPNLFSFDQYVETVFEKFALKMSQTNPYNWIFATRHCGSGNDQFTIINSIFYLIFLFTYTSLFFFLSSFYLPFTSSIYIFLFFFKSFLRHCRFLLIFFYILIISEFITKQTYAT